jgi:voltage-gated potassium channel Kch
MAAITLRQRARYWFDNTMSKGTPALVRWLALASLAVIVVGGTLVWALDNSPGDGAPHRAFLPSIWQGVLHALDPGTVAGDGGHWWYVAIAFAITVGGILIVAAFIGVLTTGLDAKLTELRKGRSAIIERNHTVLLGWSDQVFTILSELIEANSNQKRSCIAILADRDKVEMEDEIREKLGKTRRTRVVCRSGNPVDPGDIAMVNPAAARSVIVLPSADEDRDAYLIKTLLAVSRSRDGQPGSCRIVGSVADPHNLPAAKLAGGPDAQLIDATDVAARIIVQTCLQSGLSVVYSDLLDFGGDEIYFHQEPSLVGATYAHALHAFQTSSVIGMQMASGQIVLNPPSNVRISPGDRLIAISQDDDTIVPGPPAIVAQQVIVAYPDPPPVAKHTLILGWNMRAPDVLRQLDEYVPAGSDAYIVARHASASPAVAALFTELRNVVLNFKEDDSADRTVLESLNVGAFDNVIVLCSDDVNAQLADSRTLVTLLHLRDIQKRTGGRFTIVSEMADDRNRALVQATQADDFIVSEKLLSLMTTQISENPHLATVFASLFEAEGSEIYLKGAEWYVRLGQTVNFQTVVEAARLRGESAIGYRLASRSLEAPAYGVVLNPNKAEPLTLREGDRIIVLAEN